jgi:hypothetical protein
MHARTRLAPQTLAALRPLPQSLLPRHLHKCIYTSVKPNVTSTDPKDRGPSTAAAVRGGCRSGCCGAGRRCLLLAAYILVVRPRGAQQLGREPRRRGPRALGAARRALEPGGRARARSRGHARHRRRHRLLQRRDEGRLPLPQDNAISVPAARRPVTSLAAAECGDVSLRSCHLAFFWRVLLALPSPAAPMLPLLHPRLAGAAILQLKAHLRHVPRCRAPRRLAQPRRARPRDAHHVARRRRAWDGAETRGPAGRGVGRPGRVVGASASAGRSSAACCRCRRFTRAEVAPSSAARQRARGEAQEQEEPGRRAAAIPGTKAGRA